MRCLLKLSVRIMKLSISFLAMLTMFLLSVQLALGAEIAIKFGPFHLGMTEAEFKSAMNSSSLNYASSTPGRYSCKGLLLPLDGFGPFDVLTFQFAQVNGSLHLSSVIGTKSFQGLKAQRSEFTDQCLLKKIESMKSKYGSSIEIDRDGCHWSNGACDLTMSDNLTTGGDSYAISVVASTRKSAAAIKVVETNQYPGELFKKYPKALAAYKKIVPLKWSKIDWLYDLYGAEWEAKNVEIDGRKFFLSVVTENHNFPNNVACLTAIDGSAAYAIVHSDTLNRGKDIILGNPRPEIVKLLNDQFGVDE